MPSFRAGVSRHSRGSDRATRVVGRLAGNFWDGTISQFFQPWSSSQIAARCTFQQPTTQRSLASSCAPFPETPPSLPRHINFLESPLRPSTPFSARLPPLSNISFTLYHKQRWRSASSTPTRYVTTPQAMPDVKSWHVFSRRAPLLTCCDKGQPPLHGHPRRREGQQPRHRGGRDRRRQPDR